MYFDLRLFAMTQGLRLRILLAALVGLVGLPLSLGRLALSGVVIASVSLQRREAYSALGADFLDGIQGLATLKAFGQSRARGALLAERARQLYRGTMAVLAANCATGGLTLLGISAGAAVALGWGAVRVSQGELLLQTLAIVLMLGVEVFRPLRELTSLYHRGMVAMSATNGIYTILDQEPEVRDPAGGAPTPDRATERRRDGATGPFSPSLDLSVSPSVTFEHVSFAYPGRPWALEDISFTLRAGERLVLVGPSGTGKSTIVWLLLRFFDPQQG